MGSLLLALIYISFIGLGLPDSLLGSSWPVVHMEMGVPMSYAGVVSAVIFGGTVLTSLFSGKLLYRFGTGTITISLINGGQPLWNSVFGENPILIFILAPGGFFVFGMLIMLANKIAEKKGKEKAQLHSCKACPMFATCTAQEKEECDK